MYINECEYCGTDYDMREPHTCPIECPFCGKENATIEHVGTHYYSNQGVNPYAPVTQEHTIAAWREKYPLTA